MSTAYEDRTLEDYRTAGRAALEAGKALEAEEIFQQAQERFPQETARVVSPAQEPEDLHGDMMTSLTNIPTGIADSLEPYLNPETYTAEAIPGDPSTSNPVTAGANVLRPALSAAGPVAQAGWDTWWNTFGRGLPEGSKDTVEQGFKDLTSGLVERWDAFSEANPLEAALMEDTGVVAELIGVRVPGAKTLTKLERRQRGKGNLKAIEDRRQGLYKMVRTKDSEGFVDESSTVTGRREQWTPDQGEKNMATALETIDGVDPNRSYTYNHAQTDKAVRGWGAQLDKLLGKHHKTKIPKQDILDEFDATFEDLSNIEGYHALSTDASAQFDKLVLEARRLVEQSGKTDYVRPKDLLKIRQEFDRLFKGAGGSLEQSTKSARNVSATQLRNVLNDTLKRNVNDPDVHDLLDRQHEGLKAKKILRDKREVERNNGVTRVLHKIAEFGHLPRTPLALYATGAAAATAGAPYLGAAAAAGATGLTAYQVYKGLTGPARHKALAQVLSVINKASKKDPKFRDAIAAERAILVEMLKETQQEPESD